MREARIEVCGDRKAQDDIPQEREPLVRVPALLDPRRVCERLASKVRWQLVE
jgi:hypothetical protein